MSWRRGRGREESAESRGSGGSRGDTGGGVLGADQRRGLEGHAGLVEAAGGTALATGELCADAEDGEFEDNPTLSGALLRWTAGGGRPHVSDFYSAEPIRIPKNER